ncbi:MAG: hypothetical protein A2046_16015 [Bacteroidetes bacterium GWA2_30_7]|nr:MAG: hypothetical protein A2046_16015 [Bacteroidetes bacterium GWA2_30_7]
MPNQNKKQIFEGITILDFCQVIAGSYATTLLADLGAEIIKVEPPEVGDTLRNTGPKINGVSTFFIQVNRNKKSLCIDLKSPKGLEIIKKLIPHVDVISENFKPGVMEKFGLSYEDVKKLKENIIYVSVSGYGHNNKNSHKPAYDIMIQAESGLASLNGFPENNMPLRSPLSVVDYISATNAAFAISSALYHLKATGIGQFVDIAMYDSIISIMDNSFLIYESIKNKSEIDLIKEGIKSTGNHHPGTSPHGCYKTSDGYIAHTSLTNEMWSKILKIIEREDLLNNEKFNSPDKRKQSWQEVDKILEEWSSKNSTDEVIKAFYSERLPCGKVRNIDEVFNDSHNSEREIFKEINHPIAGRLKITNTPMKFNETPVQIKTNAPSLGEHTKEIMNKYLNLSDSELNTLFAYKVLF